MDLKELKRLLFLGESPNVEFKAYFDLDVAGKSICSFLNSSGGYIVFGIQEKDKKVLGVELKKNFTEIEKEIIKNITPKALIYFELNEIEGKNIILIEIPSGKDVPYAFKNDILIKVDNKIQKADIDTIRDMVMRRQNEPERWERRFSDADLDSDFDYSYIDYITKLIKDNGKFNFLNATNFLKPLEDLGVIKYGRLTNAGDVLFTKNPAVRKPQTRVKAVCFNSDKTDSEYTDLKYFEGSLFYLLDETFKFIMRNIPTKAYFVNNSLERKDKPLYPPEAIREALVNAFVHRDYSNFSGGLGVYVYPNRLEICNSGELPEGINLDSLLKGHISILRNPDIAHIVYLGGKMEKMGRGSLLIQKACKDYGLPNPEWKNEKNQGVTLTFFNTQNQDLLPQVTPQVTPQVKNLLEVINGEMTREELQYKLELKDRKSFRELYIKPALELGLIEMTMPDKPNSKNQRYRKIL